MLRLSEQKFVYGKLIKIQKYSRLEYIYRLEITRKLDSRRHSVSKYFKQISLSFQHRFVMG